MATLR